MTPTDPEIEALLGGTPPPSTSRRERDLILKAASGGKGTFVEAGVLMRPVTRAFLGQVFRLDENIVRRRLLHCPTLGRHGQRDLYDFATACSYLVEPKIDIEQYLRTTAAKNLPVQLNKDFWDGQQRKLKYQIAAGEAWHTEDVVEVLGSVCMKIKDRLQLVTETMRDRAKLDDSQTKRFTEMIDGLQADIHADLVSLPAASRHGPIGDELLVEGDGE